MRDTTRRRIGTALAVYALASGLPAAAGAPTWALVKSPNFSVYSDAGAKEARQVALQFEQVRLAFEKLWPGARTIAPRPVVILAVRDENALKGLLPEYFARKGGLRPAGFTVSGSDKHYVALRTDVADYAAAGYNPYHLIYHEYIHVLIDLNVSQVPAWFGEGLAEFFGATIVEGGRLVIGKPLPWHIDTLREKPMFDLERLIRIERGSPEYNEDSKAGIFYAQSWALVHMLATDPTSAAGAKRLNALLALLKSGQDSQAAARGALGDLGAMDKELRSYVHRYAFRYGHVNADARLDGRSFPSRDVSAAEALALQGDFHVHRGQNASARPLLDQAAALDPRLALVHAARGLLAWREQGQEAALPHYQRAVELDTDDFFTQAMLGQTLARQQTPDALARAEAALSRAVELNHEYAPAYERLASVIVQRGGDLERALGLARRAVALQPADADARLTVSWALQRAGRNDEALQEAQGALRVARDEAVRGRVQEWLGELARPAARNVAAAESGARVSSGVARPPAEQQQRCDAGQLDDCAALGDRYRAGDGVSADAPRALGLYTRACDGGLVAGCVTLGWAQLAGDLGARDPAAAARAFGKACDGGVLDGCAQAGFVLAFAAEVKHDEAAAAPFLRKACEGGQGRACSGLGVLHMNGQGVKRDLTRAAALLERGCAAADAMGCLNLAALLEVGAGVQKDAVRARELYGKACAQGVAPACKKVESAAK